MFPIAPIVVNWGFFVVFHEGTFLRLDFLMGRKILLKRKQQYLSMLMMSLAEEAHVLSSLGNLQQCGDSRCLAADLDLAGALLPAMLPVLAL